MREYSFIQLCIFSAVASITASFLLANDIRTSCEKTGIFSVRGQYFKCEPIKLTVQEIKK